MVIELLLIRVVHTVHRHVAILNTVELDAFIYPASLYTSGKLVFVGCVVVLTGVWIVQAVYAFALLNRNHAHTPLASPASSYKGIVLSFISCKQVLVRPGIIQAVQRCSSICSFRFSYIPSIKYVGVFWLLRFFVFSIIYSFGYLLWSSCIFDILLSLFLFVRCKTQGIKIFKSLCFSISELSSFNNFVYARLIRCLIDLVAVGILIFLLKVL